ncbi:MAG: hypothetical protein ACJAWF_002719, partial [Candidatus Azotimanducaceae bacterium]
FDFSLPSTILKSERAEADLMLTAQRT